MAPREKVLITAAALGECVAAGAPVSSWPCATRACRTRRRAAHPRRGRRRPADGTRLARRRHAGSRPLPAIEALQQHAIGWGLRQDGPVVLYDHDRCLTAARGWWVLRWAGLPQVRLLDGGFAAWTAAGLAGGDRARRPPPGDVALSPGHMAVLDADAAAAMARAGVLLDTRIRGNYIGGAVAAGPAAARAYPGQPQRAGGGYADRGRHLRRCRDPAAPVAALGADGTRPLGVTCGAGISAAHGVAALASIGVDAAMFPGSWSAWSADPARPAVVGASRADAGRLNFRAPRAVLARALQGRRRHSPRDHHA